MELFAANAQWSTRPKDQRFTSLDDLHSACKGYADTARERNQVPVDSLRVENVDGDVQLMGRGGVPARLTHWSFGQLSARIGAPASYLRTLPATLAAQNLNHGLAKRAADSEGGTVNLLFHQNGSLLLRALTSDKYARVWNHEITDRLLDLQGKGWEPARADIRIKAEDDLPLYASDHDMFAFLRHSDRMVKEGSSGQSLHKGIIVSNSEVGASKLRLLKFLYREMCGNHIIWGAEDVIELSLRHVGTIREQLQSWGAEITKYMDSSVSDQEAQIEYARTKTIAATKDQLLDVLFGKKAIGLSRKTLQAGYDATLPDQDGDPRTVWGLVQGLTRYSQTIPYADERTIVDRAAGKVLDLASTF
jgi:hypothetical protein